MKSKVSLMQSRTLKIFVSNILIIVLLDFFVSKVAQKYNSYIDEKQNTIEISNSIYHHTFKSNYTERKYEKRVGSYKIITNSLGFRDKKMRYVENIPTKKRLLFIGDSFTEGVLLNYEKTFVGIIDEKLEKKNIEVLNAAVASYSPIIYWRKIKDLIETKNIKFDHLIVFIDISDSDDEANIYELSSDSNVINRNNPIRGKNNFSETNEIESIKTFIKKNTFLIYFITNWISDKFFGTKSDDINYYTLKNYYSGRALWTIDEKVFKEWGSKGVDLMKFYMDKLLKLLKKNNIDLTVAVYPWPNQIWHEDLDSKQVKLWEEWCNINQIKFINFFPYFIKKNMKESYKIDLINRYYLPYDIHFNSRGNDLIAKKFLEIFYTE